MSLFSLHSQFAPAGDQPQAIAKLTQAIANNQQNQTLLGVTGSGKTFTMAHVIANIQRPTLILAHNKTLAAQLYSEMRDFFPNNAVEYFVSYYDYYQPEAYVARSDTYIGKEATINEQIDRMRHSATRAILERRDVIIVASVSCIYGIGDAETYSRMIIDIETTMKMQQQDFLRRAIALQYHRNDQDFARGRFRVRGDIVDIFPAHLEDCAWRISFFGDEIDNIKAFDPLTGNTIQALKKIRIYANSHYVTPKPTIQKAIGNIQTELKQHLEVLRNEEKLLEAQRLEQRTIFDLEMMQATGMCQGIENYSRFLSGRAPGVAPPTLFEYLPDNALLFVDESHVMIPQIHAMYHGDFSRKSTLVRYGFRLPSCMDNRPLKFEEWDAMRPKTTFVSATPNQWEIDKSNGQIIEQIVRPTGLLDPPYDIRPIENQVDDLVNECRKKIAKGGRILVTTLTKRFSEDLTDYMEELGLKVRYLHSDVETLERIEIIRDLRIGHTDILIGINLLREGLDIPECSLVAILDADKEGFLRSKTSLIQTMGRAARNLDGLVILYADRITKSMQYALDETDRRRAKQKIYNEKQGITPETIVKNIRDGLYEKGHQKNLEDHLKNNFNLETLNTDHDLILDTISLKNYLPVLEKTMRKTADDLNFEEATKMRDELKKLRYNDLEIPIRASNANIKIAIEILATSKNKKLKIKKRR